MNHRVVTTEDGTKLLLGHDARLNQGIRVPSDISLDDVETACEAIGAVRTWRDGGQLALEIAVAVVTALHRAEQREHERA